MEGLEPSSGCRFVPALIRGPELLRCFRPESSELAHPLLARRSGLPNAYPIKEVAPRTREMGRVYCRTHVTGIDLPGHHFNLAETPV